MYEDNLPTGVYDLDELNNQDDDEVELEEGEEREEPLLGHPVRIKDSCDIITSINDQKGKPMKSYPLSSTKFQLGEFAGFVQEVSVNKYKKQNERICIYVYCCKNYIFKS